LSQDVLIIGGGISGIQAALDLGDQGFHVYLVERTPSIGGRMSQLDKTFPTLDCSACILTPKMVDAGSHPNIELMTYSEVKEVTGKAGNFKVKVLKKPRYVNIDMCVGCGTCASKCPMKISSEFNSGLSKRSAIYVPFPQAVPLKYTIDADNCLYLTKGVCGLCEQVCPASAIDFNEEEKVVELDVGAIIVATGFDPYDPSAETVYGYQRFPNVITGLEFERLINASGPTHGHIERPSDQELPKRVAFVQCVGSRNEKIGNPYCSRVCCMYAIKNAILMKEHYPDTDVSIFYIDIRAFGKGFEEFYKRAEEEFGIKFIKGRVSEIQEDPGTHNLFLKAFDTISGTLIHAEADLAVLSVGLRPPKGHENLAKMLDIQLSDNGFFAESDLKYSPVNTTRDGIFIAGASQGPKDIPDSVAQASGAASAAAVLLSKVKVGE